MSPQKSGPPSSDLEHACVSAEGGFPGVVIAVIIPCYDEAAAVAQTIRAFHQAIPGAVVYVYDNNSQDATKQVAQAAGAIVRNESRQGKGNVVRRMFADVEADLYVLVDGDATYDAESGRMMIELLLKEGLDMVVGCRKDQIKEAYRRGHRLGNLLLTEFLARMFDRAFTDTLSGYRVFSRRFVKTFPSLSSGFEIETEINVHALSLRMPIGEVATPYVQRGEGSVSKLNTYRDGIRILMIMINLFRQEKPGLFFLIMSAIPLALAIGFSIPLMITYEQTGLVPRLPTALACTGLVIIAFLNMVCGLILDTVTLGRREVRRLAYLNHPGPHGR